MASTEAGIESGFMTPIKKWGVMKDLPESVQKRIKQRVQMKKISHDVKKSINGFCSNPFCMFCKKDL